MDSLGGLLFPLLILLLFIPIFLSGRKQRAQVQQMQQLQAALEVGDVVTTTSGLRGTVVDASYEDTVDLEIADGVVTTWVRAAVREKVTTEPAADATDTTAAVDDAPVTGSPVVDAPATSGASTADAAPSLTKDETPRS
jgi:preprotein translocase subunit YajC